ncbi:hypothetical protein PENSPDRAFT_121982 [Peniophora sp. CONT]|nr:hypothetical protein PENSPDRAFT_121982 [Peniophora sp. CONT]
MLSEASDHGASSPLSLLLTPVTGYVAHPERFTCYREKCTFMSSSRVNVTLDSNRQSTRKAWDWRNLSLDKYG